MMRTHSVTYLLLMSLVAPYTYKSEKRQFCTGTTGASQICMCIALSFPKKNEKPGGGRVFQESYVFFIAHRGGYEYKGDL